VKRAAAPRESRWKLFGGIETVFGRPGPLQMPMGLLRSMYVPCRVF